MPNTLAENLQRLKIAKTAIGNAITAKGGTVGANDGLEDFASDIETIPDYKSTLADLIEGDTVSIDIPDGVTKIRVAAFYSCLELVNVTIPSTVTSIDPYAFYNCVRLSSITIPDSVTSIGACAFYKCSILSYIKFESTTPPTVANSNAWNYMSVSAKILVPAGTLETYKSATNYPNPSTYTYEEY